MDAARQSFDFSDLTELSDHAIREFDGLPHVVSDSDLGEYREKCKEALRRLVEFVRTQTHGCFDFAGIEYRSLMHRHVLKLSGVSPIIAYAGEEKYTSNTSVTKVYDYDSFPFLEILRKNWVHVRFVGTEKESQRQPKHVIVIDNPFCDIEISTVADVTADHFKQRLQNQLRTTKWLGADQREYYAEISPERLEEIIVHSSSMTMTILRDEVLKHQSCSSRSILYVSSYLRMNVRVGGIVFMGKRTIKENECHGLGIATKMILGTFRLLEETANHSSMQLERENNQIRSFLLTRMRHDIRHPFFESLTFLGRLGAKTKMFMEAVQSLQDLESQTSALGGSLRSVMQMIDQTLFSLETGMFGDVPIHKIRDSVNDFLDDFSWLFRESMPEGRRLEIRRVPENTIFSYDPAIIREVLTNLVRNALSYTKGDIVVEARRRDDEHVVISVIDHGEGLPEHIRSSLGAPFLPPSALRSDPAESIGRGLSICHRLMEIHGTGLTVDRDYEGGTKFDVTIGPSNSSTGGIDEQGVSN